MPLHQHTKPVIVIGFGIILALLASLAAIWLFHIKSNNQRLTQLLSAQEVSEQIFIMRDAAHKRALALYRMAVLEDPFDKDKEYVNFMAQAGKFIVARDRLLSQGMPADKLKAWEVAQPLIRQGSDRQTQTLELILEGNISQAHQLLTTQVIPIQNTVMDYLSEMLETQKQATVSDMEHISAQSEAVFATVFMLGTAALVLGTLIAWFVIKTTTNNQRALIDAREEALLANRHKSIFLANMSHELRTPLNAIVGYSEILHEEAREIGAQQFVDDLQKIHSAGGHLLGVINEILDLSKIEAGKMEFYPEQFDLAAMITEISHTLQPLLEKNQNQLRSTVHLRNPICNDSTKLRQTLYNLLSNACKFTHKGVITLAVSEFDKANATWIKIIVSDTGIGISQEKLKEIFNPFTQADNSTTRHYGGTGLGLTISKRFCAIMGGNLSVHSEPGKGSTFTITLPRYVDEPALQQCA